MNYKDAFIQIHYHLCGRLEVYEDWIKYPDKHGVRKQDAELLVFIVNNILKDMEKIESYVALSNKND